MKKIIMLLVTGAIALGFIACNDDETGKDKIISADELYLPRNNYPVDLAKSPTVQFEWAASKTNAGGYIVYEVLFDKEDGDFSNPLYIIPSSNKGFNPSVDISSTVLNTIATSAGAAPGETATVKWTVRAWRKLSSTNYSSTYAVRMMTISRPNRVDPLPEEVSIKGTSTENAAAILLNEALPVSESNAFISDRESGAFECFTKLAVGTMSVVDDMGRYFTLDENGVINRAEENATSSITKEGVYWVYLNFNNMSWTMTEITEVRLWNKRGYDSDPASLTPLTYKGNGVWNLDKFAWNIGNESKMDSRHYFQAVYADGIIERWAHWEDDCRNPDPASNAKYFNIYRFVDGSIEEWTHTWKTLEEKREGYDKLVTFNIYMNNANPKKPPIYRYDRVFTDKDK